MADVNFCGRCGHSVERHFDVQYGCDMAGCNCTRKRYECGEPNGYDRQPKPSLQLLVIDLGDSCVVKVERGVIADHRTLFNDLTEMVYWHSKVDGITAHPFAAVRDAIDSQDAPLPRVEHSPAGSQSEYRLVLHDDSNLVCPERSIGMTHADLQGLTTFIRGTVGVGTPLPIYEPTEGKWERLPSTDEYMGDPLEGTGIAIYRYTRGGG